MKTSVKFIFTFILLMLVFSKSGDIRNFASASDKCFSQGCTSFDISECSHSDGLTLGSIGDKLYCNKMLALSFSDVELGFKLCSESYSTSNSLRSRRVIELSDFFKGLLYGLCLRENLLVLDKSKNYHSDKESHIARPSCEYYVFALRRILI